MALSDIIRSGVAIADRLTSSLQPVVLHRQWMGNDGVGGYLFTDAVPRQALVELKSKLVRTMAGDEKVSSHVISFLRPIAPLNVVGRDNPIDGRDKFELPDGSSGLILSVESFLDPSIGAGYYHQVYLQGNTR